MSPAERRVKILEFLRERGPTRTRNIAPQLGLEYSDVHNSLQFLKQKGQVVQDERVRWRAVGPGELKVIPFEHKRVKVSEAAPAAVELPPLVFPAGNVNLEAVHAALSLFRAQWTGPADDAFIVSVVLSSIHLENAIEEMVRRAKAKKGRDLIPDTATSSA